MISTAYQPVIILGMHRSGTSMISSLLDKIGLFVGADIQEHHESAYFLKFNEVLYERVHATWDNPLPVRQFLAHAEAVQMTVNALKADLLSPGIEGFLGKTNKFCHQSLVTFDRPWGWKDPRTVFTLPLWLQLFPRSKLIYIIRNGVDVAASLRVRELRDLRRCQERAKQGAKPLESSSHLECAGYKGSARCLSLKSAFALWEEYVAEADENLKNASSTRLVFRYEDFLKEPAKLLADLAIFCELPAVSRQLMNDAVSYVDQDRSKRFASDPELLAFYNKVKSTTWMSEYQY